MIRKLLALALCLHALPAAADGPNSFNYNATPSSTIDWIPVSGAQQIMAANTAQQAATVDLIAPAVLFGRVTNKVVVSRHGYVAWGDTDDGTDNSFDCPLPQKPSNTPSSETRLYPLHGDFSNSSDIFYEYIAPGTHSSSRWGAHVFTWTGAKLASGGPVIDFQALVFDDFQIVYQYQTTGTWGDGVTVGLQGAESGSEFLSIYCDLTGAFVGNHQLVIDPPTLNFPHSISAVDFAQALALWPDGTRICFNTSGNANIGGGNLQKTVSLVAPTAGPVTFLGTTLTFPGGGSMLGINLSNGRANSTTDLLIRDALIAGDISGQTPVTAPRVIVFDSTFDNCADTGSNGGGAVRAGEVHATDCDFTNCEAFGVAIITQGGAIKVDGNADSTLTRCTFQNNTSSGAGGAVYASGGGSLDITDCTFDGNSSDGIQSPNTGGAVVLSSTDSTVQRSLFTNNDGGTAGGALSISGTSSVQLRNSAFDSNSADNRGAIQHTGDLLDIRHCNIVRNSNNSAGGFIIGGNDSPTVSQYSLYNANNRSALDPASSNFTSLGQNCVPLGSVQPFATPGDLLSNLAIMVTPLSGGTALNSGTPLLGANTIDGTSLTAAAAGGSATDLRGYPRLLGSTVDIGAYEFLESVVVNSTSDDPTPGGPVSFREAWERSDHEIIYDTSLVGATITLTSPLPERVRRTSVGFPAQSFLNGRFVTLDGAAADAISIGAMSRWENTRFANFTGYALTAAPSYRTSVVLCEFTGNGGAVSGPFSEGSINRLTAIGCRFYDNGDPASPMPLIDTRRAEITNCQFDHNLGGPVFQLTPNNATSLYPTLRLTETTIARNTGRAIFLPSDPGNLDRAEIEILSSTISTNADDNSSTIDCDHAIDLTITGSTIANNGGDTSTTNACIATADGSSSITTTSSVYENNKLTFSDQGAIASGGHNIFDGDMADFWLAGTDLENTKTHLAPISRYTTPEAIDGMPELQHALLAISPAIDSGDGPGTDGDGDGTGTADRGAFEAGPVTFVTTTTDSGPGSLRQAVLDTASGGRILFAPSIGVASSISLTADINITEDVQIDATNRRRGLRITGNGTTRIFDVLYGARFAIHALDLSDGGGAGLFSSALRIRDGWGTASHCSIIDCEAVRGPAAYVEIGGLYLLNCTITGNSSTASGGALDFLAGTENRIEHCTIARNFSDNGGALRFRSGTLVRASYNVFADNFLGTPAAPGVPADFFVGDESTFPDRFISGGYNTTTDTSSGIDNAFGSTGDETDIASPGYGTGFNATGWSRTISPINLSDIRNQNATPSVFPTFDGSGYARVADFLGVGIDLGSREFGGDTLDTDNDGLPDYWEYLYGFEPLSTDDSAGNPDADGADNLTEFQNGTHPRLFDVPLPIVLPEIISFGRSTIDPDDIVIVFQGPAATDYEFQVSTDLETWTKVFDITTSGSPQSTTQPTTPVRIFYRFAIPE